MNSDDPFAKARPKAKITTNEMPSTKDQSDPFARARPKPSSGIKTAAKYGVQTITRPTEALISIPGNLLRFVRDVGLGAVEKATGKDLSGFRKTLETTAPFKLLPGSAEARQASSALTGGLSEPEGELQQTYGDVLDLGTLLLSGASNPKAWQALARAGLTALGAVGTGKVAKGLGFGETSQAISELGTLGLASTIRPGAIQKYLGNAYDQLYRSPIAKSVVPTSGWERQLDKLQAQWKRGGTTPAARAAMPKLEELQAIAKKGNVEIDEVLDSYKKINAELQSRDLFDKLDKPGRQALRTHFDELKDAGREMVRSSTPPEFFKEWSDINKGYSIYARSKAVSDWVLRNRDTILKVAGPGVVADLFMSFGASGPAAAGAVAGFAVKEIGETLARIGRSSKLRKYYGETLKAIASENTPAAVKSIQKLKMAMEKEEDHH